MRTRLVAKVVARNGPAASSLFHAVLIVGAVAAVAVLGSGGSPGGGKSDPAAAMPPDVARLGLIVEPYDSPRVARADAIARAKEVVGEQASVLGGEINAYVGLATDPASARLGPRAITDRPIWLIRFSGFELTFPGPMSEDGVPAAGHTARFAYVLVDASTGEALDLQFWE